MTDASEFGVDVRRAPARGLQRGRIRGQPGRAGGPGGAAAHRRGRGPPGHELHAASATTSSRGAHDSAPGWRGARCATARAWPRRCTSWRVRAEEDREAHRRAAVADERRRLAREMHDVVAHSISVMVVQAGGARRILDRDPARAAEAAGAHRADRARGAHRDAAAARRPARRPTSAPSARRSPGWTASTSSSSARGRPACRSSCTSWASAASCPAASSWPPTASCRRRSRTPASTRGAAPAEVTLRYGARRARARGRRPRRRAPRRPAATGAATASSACASASRVYGGELEAGPRPGGGFAVRARLPVGAAEVLPA